MLKKENIFIVVLIGIAVLGVLYWENMKKQDVEPVNIEAGIPWQEYSEGMALAQSQNKHVFLYFYADW